MAEMHFCTMEPPFKWQAGTVGKDPGMPFYFDCAGCGAKEPELAGVFARPGLGGDVKLRREDIGVERTPDGFYKLCLYCVPCTAARVEKARAGQSQEVAP